MIIRVLFTVSFLGVVLAQDDNKLINVKQIMRDTFDILKNIPPPTNFNQVSKVMFPTTTLPPVYYYNNNNQGNAPQLSPDEYQALLTAQSNRPLTIQQRSILFNLHQRINAQKQYTQTQGGQYNQNQYYQRAPQTMQQPQQPQQQPAIMNPINRIFATPTEKDMERLLRLPADILYKIAEEGHYIDPEDESQGYSHSKTISKLDRPLPAGVSSSDSSNPGLFGNGFSFNVGENNAGQITNPFLTKEDVKKEKPTSEPKSKQEKNTAASKSAEKLEIQNTTKEITYQNSGDKVDKSKPYFVVNNGEWQLVVPQPDDKPALQIPVKDFTKLTEAVARASARSGMPVDMAKMVAAEELHVKTSEATTLPEKVSTTETTDPPKKAPKKVEKTPTSAFVQEAENLKSEEEEKAPAPATKTEEEVITLNGKVYKLVKEEKPKKKKTKKIKKSQTTGEQKNALPQPSQTETPLKATTHIPLTSPMVAQASGVPAVNAMNPVQLPGLNQPLSLSTLSQYRQQPLTYEQQQILAELQQRFLQSQAMLTQQQPKGQNPYIQNYNAQQLPAAATLAAQQMSQPYYQKVSPPPIIPQMPSVNDQIPIKVQHYPTQAVVSKAAAAPVKIIKETPHHIDPTQANLPKQKVYSLQELDRFYNMQNSEITTEAPAIKETTTKKVYAPHRQIKIRMNSNEENVEEDEQLSKTTVVDATADAIDEEKKRIAELRRRFALERQQLSKRNRAKFEKTTNIEPTTPPSFAITEQHCYNIKSFAKQAGSSNVYEYAISHCHYIENYYPDLKCANVDDYIKVCQRYYSTRRMLFS
uniref:Uncharacterized protein n=1 Tax=Panagrolaimus sp. PS1159 TaxID=55785 RepID=A0AC35GVX3_9BILA